MESNCLQRIILGVLLFLNGLLLVGFFFIRAKLYDVYRVVTLLFMGLTLIARIALYTFYFVTNF